MNVSKEVSQFIWDQLCGDFNGDNAPKPYHPVLQCLIKKHDGDSAQKFPEFLRAVADAFEASHPDFNTKKS